MARLQEFYRDTVIKQLTEQFGYKSPMEVPRISKITLNMGVGEAVADKKVLDHALDDMTKIAGQKPVMTKQIGREFQDSRGIPDWRQGDTASRPYVRVSGSHG